MSLEAAAAARKARIHALRALRTAEDAGDAQAIAENTLGAAVKASFRAAVVPPALLAAPAEPTVERDVGGAVERALELDTKAQAGELALDNIAPRKPNWDLRRDLDERLAALAPATQRAIHTLIGTCALG